MVQSRPHPGAPFSSVGSHSEYSYDGSNTTTWYPDSGATNHVSSDLNNLNISSEYTGGSSVQGNRAPGNT
ncbi:hypothetical protein AAHA92_09035 [Salvia divinorum]|uniref:Uncharacterized protein n=1 Tax=Salvia divinorum TaxID=28513 RepID=A0ABD1HQX8_SALDI